MGNGGLRNLSFVSRPAEAVRERAEPRLVTSNPPAMSRRPAELNSGLLTNLRNDGPNLGIAPVVSAADRQSVSSGKREGSTSRFVTLAAVAALAAGIIGAIAGTGLLSSTPPEKKTIAAVRPPEDLNPSGADRSSAPIPAQAPTPRAVAADIAGAPGEQPKAKTIESKAPPDVSKPTPPAVAAKPVPPAFGPPPEKPVKLAKSTAAPEIAPSSAATRGEAKQGPTVVRPAAEAGHPAHPQVAARHSHPRSAHEVKLVNSATIPEHASTARHSERPTRTAETLTPPSEVSSEPAASAHYSQRTTHAAETSAPAAAPDRALAARHRQRATRIGESPAETAATKKADQTAEFDQLLTNLTGSAKPAAEPRAAAAVKPPGDGPPTRSASAPPPFLGPSLTPPGPGAPDPFALRAPDRPSAQ
jgi:hypothetical protein